MQHLAILLPPSPLFAELAQLDLNILHLLFTSLFFNGIHQLDNFILVQLTDLVFELFHFLLEVRGLLCSLFSLLLAWAARCSTILFSALGGSHERFGISCLRHVLQVSKVGYFSWVINNSRS